MSKLTTGIIKFTINLSILTFPFWCGWLLAQIDEETKLDSPFRDVMVLSLVFSSPLLLKGIVEIDKSITIDI
jgi:hypothetical protein